MRISRSGSKMIFRLRATRNSLPQPSELVVVSETKPHFRAISGTNMERSIKWAPPQSMRPTSRLKSTTQRTQLLSLKSGRFRSSAVRPRMRADGGALGDQRRALDRGAPKRVTPARLVRAWGSRVMPDQDESDAMTKAWTYAVLDALEAADEATRLEIARILCPAGFVIVPTESMELPRRQKN